MDTDDVTRSPGQFRYTPDDETVDGDPDIADRRDGGYVNDGDIDWCASDATLAEHHAWYQASRTAGDLAGAFNAWQALERDMEEVVLRLADEADAVGWSWDEIGAEIGETGREAAERVGWHPQSGYVGPIAAPVVCTCGERFTSWTAWRAHPENDEHQEVLAVTGQTSTPAPIQPPQTGATIRQLEERVVGLHAELEVVANRLLALQRSAAPHD